MAPREAREGWTRAFGLNSRTKIKGRVFTSASLGLVFGLGAVAKSFDSFQPATNPASLSVASCGDTTRGSVLI
jgi:hypothetical protein